MRLIDADALMEKVCGNCQGYDCAPDATDTVYGCELAEIINQMPTIEPEVRHGRWKGWTTSKFTGRYKDYDEPEFKDYVYYTCSECYRKSAIQELYCPACGARMDGGADNG